MIRPGGVLGAWLRRNPIALKELRGRMRGPRAFVVLTVYVALMSLFATLLYLIYVTTASLTFSTTGSVIGKLIFGGVVLVEFLLVSFIMPAFTAGAISGERERRTFALLRTTLLPANRLVDGKLLSALAYVVLLLFVAVPLQSLAFLMGGVTMIEVLLSFELLIVTAVGFGALGIFLSAKTGRTLSASILTYMIILLVTIVLPLLVLLLTAILGPLTNLPALEGLLTYLGNLFGVVSPIGAAILTEAALQQHGPALFYTQTLSNGASILLIAPWVIFSLVYGVISLVLIRLTVRLVRQTEA
jgi:hypothetical protein